MMQTFYTEDPQQLNSMLEVRKLKHATLRTVQGRLVHGHVLCFVEFDILVLCT